MKRIILLLSLVLAVFTSTAQNKDEIIFKAMDDEMSRSIGKLNMPGYESPFYMSSIISESTVTSISASLGSLTSVRRIPLDRTLAINMLVGDYNLNNGEQGYVGDYYETRMAIGDNYDQMRREIWEISDIAYKRAAAMFQNKTYTMARLVDKQDVLADMIKAAPVTKISNAAIPVDFDVKGWEQKARDLSSIFLEYPKLFGTSVNVVAVQVVKYLKTSEGTVAKQPCTIFSVFAGGNIEIPEEQVLGETSSLAIASDVNDLPSYEKLAEGVRKLADKLMAKSASESVSEYYFGPVLFENSAVTTIFTSLLLNDATLLPYRKPLNASQANKTLEQRQGKRVIDQRFTVKNYTQLKEYNGQKLFGHYEIDAEGVVPQKELMLIDKGIFKTTLTSRFPTKLSSESTGSMRMGTGVGEGSISVAPGTLHIIADGGIKREQMKKMLIKAAVAEGNNYAYIARNVGGNTELFRVDVKTGVETAVKRGELNMSQVDLNKLRRVAAVSKEEQVKNIHYNNSIPVTVICPESVMLDDIEITPVQIKKEKRFFTEKPAI